MPPASGASPYILLDTEADDQRQSEQEHELHDFLPDNHIHDVHLASTAEKKRLWWRSIFINTLFVASWFGFATLLSVYNKWMFSKDHYAFPYPLFVSAIQMLVQFCLAAFVRTAWPLQFTSSRQPTKKEYVKNVMPTAVATSLDIGFSNLSLKTITLSFYTMCKSSSLIFVLAFAFIFRLEIFSIRLVGVIFLIFAGVLLMVASESHFVLDGFLLVTSASALGGLRWSLTQLLLMNKTMGLDNPPTTLFWLTPVMGVTLGIISALFDSWLALFRSQFFRTPTDTLYTIFFLIAPGAAAFCMVVSEFYVIKRVGVVPMSIASVAKEVTTIMLSSVIFGDRLTPLNLTGVGITICGIGLYTYHKYRKSIDSLVPLDAHGMPLLDDNGNDDYNDDDRVIDGVALSFELREAQQHSESCFESYDENANPRRQSNSGQRDLFEVPGSDEDETHGSGAAIQDLMDLQVERSQPSGR